MKRKYKITLSLIVLLFLLALILQVDDGLSLEAQGLVDQVDWETPNDAYLYFLGINTNLGASPLDVGKDILAEIREIESTYSSIQSYEEFPVLRDRAMLELKEYGDLCSLRDDQNCILTMFSGVDGLLRSVEVQTAKKRYLRFLATEGFSTLTKPHFLEPFGPYTFLVQANRFVNLESIALAKSGEPQLASDNLYSLLEQQRKFSLQTDNLIGRMIAYVLINETIEVLSIILEEYQLDGREIDALSQEELSLNIVIGREFMYLHSSLDIKQYDESFNAWPDWVLRMMFKPNMTVNDASLSYLHAISLSESEQSSFTGVLKPELKYSWFRNLVGSILNKISSPDLSQYIARGFDLNVKIALFNGVLNQTINEKILGEISNPYYEKQFGATVSNEQDRICMKGPLEDRRRFRCLTLKH